MQKNKPCEVVVAPLVEEFSVFYGLKMCITVFTRVHREPG
jgi:hypothetical protein